MMCMLQRKCYTGWNIKSSLMLCMRNEMEMQRNSSESERMGKFKVNYNWKNAGIVTLISEKKML